MKPLSRSLEDQITALCMRPAPFQIVAYPMAHGAPESLTELSAQTHALGRWQDPLGALQGQRIPVWSGASDRTIWSSPKMNHLFRAWHDSHHLYLCAEFNERGEARAARYACSLIQGNPEKEILWAELWGQNCYHRMHGAFPEMQREFVRDCIVHGIVITIARGLYHSGI